MAKYWLSEVHDDIVEYMGIHLMSVFSERESRKILMSASASASDREFVRVWNWEYVSLCV